MKINRFIKPIIYSFLNVASQISTMPSREKATSVDIMGNSFVSDVFACVVLMTETFGLKPTDTILGLV